MQDGLFTPGEKVREWLKRQPVAYACDTQQQDGDNQIHRDKRRPVQVVPEQFCQRRKHSRHENCKESELAKKIIRLVKDSKLKVQTSIQGEAVRISGAKRDTLQEAIQLVKKSITEFPLQFQNFRE